MKQGGGQTKRDMILRVKPWCRKWNMSVDSDKTGIVVVIPDEKEFSDIINIKLRGEQVNVVKSKKVLGVIIDNQLSLPEHVHER